MKLLVSKISGNSIALFSVVFFSVMPSHSESWGFSGLIEAVI